MDDPQDEIVRALALEGRARVIAVRADGVAARLMTAHDPGPTGAVALSRAAVAALLMGATLKGRQQVALQINGDGPLGELYAVADAQGHVRATVANPRADLPLGPDGVDLKAGFGGDGRITIVRQLDAEAPTWRGVVPLSYGSVAEDLAHYFTASEQIPTAIALAEIIGPEGLTTAGGLMVQMLPESSEEDAARMEAAVVALPPLSAFFRDGGTALGLVESLDADAQVMIRYPVAYRCPCERGRFARALLGLGVDELTALKAEEEVATCVCHFCGTEYVFDQAQLGALIYGARLQAPKSTPN